MRILHVLDHSLPLHSGYSFRTRAILKAQIAAGWEVAGITGARHAAERAERETLHGLTFFRTPQPKGGPPLVREWREIMALRKRLKQVIEQWRPDQIHVHSPVLNALAAQPVAKRLGLPLIYEIRAFWEDAAVGNGTGREGSPRYRLTRWLETRAARRADAVAVICEGLRCDLVARGIAPEKIIVSPNGVDLVLFGDPPPADAAFARSLGLEGAEVIGFVGSFYDYEGIDDLIAAMPRLAMRRPLAKLLLVGGGPMEATLRAQAEASPAADRILFVGRVPHGEVEKYYGLIDILAYPRKAMRLTELVTPLKPLEAMAQRRLVAASDVGGHRELIEDGVTGTLFPAGDPPALADALAALLDDHSGWEARREAGRAFVERDRNWSSNISRYAPIYRALAGAPATDGTPTKRMGPMTRGWLRRASALPFELPLGVALGAALAFALFAMPDALFDGYFAATGLPLLGFAGRIAAAIIFGGLAGWGTWRSLAAAGRPLDRWTVDVERPSFVPRRLDAHPDAPPRRPIFAASDLGAPLDEAPVKPRRRTARPAAADLPEVASPPPQLEPAKIPAVAAMPPAPEPEMPTVAAAMMGVFSPPVEAKAEAVPAAPATTPAGDPMPASALAPAPVVPEPVAQFDPADESIAALMRRLEEGLARRAVVIAPPSAPAAWLVRDDREAVQKASAKR